VILKQNMKKELLVKFLNNKGTDAELSEVLNWINANTQTEEGKLCILEDWNSYQETINLVEDEKFTALFDEIQEKIDRNNLTNHSKTVKFLTLSIVENWVSTQNKNITLKNKFKPNFKNDFAYDMNNKRKERKE